MYVSTYLFNKEYLMQFIEQQLKYNEIRLKNRIMIIYLNLFIPPIVYKLIVFYFGRNRFDLDRKQINSQGSFLCLVWMYKNDYIFWTSIRPFIRYLKQNIVLIKIKN